MSSILFIPSNINHVLIFYPLYLELKSNYDIKILTQGSYKNEGAEDQLEKLGIPFVTIDEYESPNPEIILKQEKTDLLIINNDSDVIPQWFVNTANIMNIPSVLIQDGVLSEFKIKSSSPLSSIVNSRGSNWKLKRLSAKLLLSKKFKKIAYGTGGCTKILVWGTKSQESLQKMNVSSERISITGNMRINEFQRIGKEKPENIILYAPTDLVFSKIIDKKEFEKILDDVCLAVSLLDDMKLVIKPHPSEDVSIFSKIIQKYPDLVQVSHENIYSLLPKSKIVVMDLSTIGLEVLAMRKPTVLFLPNLSKYVDASFYPHDLVRSKAVEYASNKEELSLCIQKSLTSENHNSNEIKKYLGPMDGNEITRSIKVIHELIQKQREH